MSARPALGCAQKGKKAHGTRPGPLVVVLLCGVCIVHPLVGSLAWLGGKRQQAQQHPAAPLSPAPTPQSPPPSLNAPAPRSHQSSQTHTPAAPPVPRLLPPGCVMSVGCGAAPFCLGFGGWGGPCIASPPPKGRGGVSITRGCVRPEQAPNAGRCAPPKNQPITRARVCMGCVGWVGQFPGVGVCMRVCACIAAAGRWLLLHACLHVRVLLLAAGHCGAMTLCAMQNHGTKAQRNQKNRLESIPCNQRGKNRCKVACGVCVAPIKWVEGCQTLTTSTKQAKRFHVTDRRERVADTLRVGGKNEGRPSSLFSPPPDPQQALRFGGLNAVRRQANGPLPRG